MISMTSLTNPEILTMSALNSESSNLFNMKSKLFLFSLYQKLKSNKKLNIYF